MASSVGVERLHRKLGLWRLNRDFEKRIESYRNRIIGISKVEPVPTSLSN